MEDQRFARTYLTILSDAAGSVLNGSNENDFRATLPAPMRLSGDANEYEVSLVEMQCGSTEPLNVETLFVYCSLVPESQIVGSNSRNLLRSIFSATTVQKTIGNTPLPITPKGGEVLINPDPGPGIPGVGVDPIPVPGANLIANVFTFGEINTVVPWRPLATTNFQDITFSIGTTTADLVSTLVPSRFTVCIRHLTRS